MNESGVWVIVPVKALEQAKTRLAPVFSPAERATLMLNLLTHTLVATRQGSVCGVRVVSPDPRVLALAGVCALPEAELGPMPDAAADPLNAILRAATDHIAARTNAAAFLILPADLPLLAGADVEAVAVLAGADAVLAPDTAGDGTNGLLLRRDIATRFTYRFGPHSRAAHSAALGALNARVRFCFRRGLQHDLDLPSDFAALPADHRAALLAAAPV